MSEGFRTELRRAFLEAGSLVLGGIAGAGASYLAFGEYWILQAACAIGGAWLARYFAYWAHATWGSRRQ